MRNIIILCLFIAITIFSCNKPEDGVPPSKLYFIMTDSLGNSLIKDKDYKIELGILDSKNNFQTTNTYQSVIMDYSYKQTNNPYVAGIAAFFPNQSYVFYMRTEKTYIDKIRVETDKSKINKVFLNDVEVTAIETRTLPNAYIFVRKTGK